MGPIVFWLVVVMVAIVGSLCARWRRKRRVERIERLGASGELLGTDVDGHNRSSGSIAQSSASFTEYQRGY